MNNKNVRYFKKCSNCKQWLPAEYFGASPHTHRCKICNRNKDWQRLYGISQDEVFRLYIKQNGECAICHGSFKSTPCVDHNHETGKIRGLLCRSCNYMLGVYEKNSDGKIEVFDSYLERYNDKNITY